MCDGKKNKQKKKNQLERDMGLDDELEKDWDVDSIESGEVQEEEEEE